MTLWRVVAVYDPDDNIYYDVVPYNFWGHIKCCIKWYGFKGLKRTYLSEKKAEKVAAKLNKEV
jgi:hypothetical protein